MAVRARKEFNFFLFTYRDQSVSHGSVQVKSAGIVSFGEHFIGLNLNQEDFRKLQATSIKNLTGKDQNIHETLFSFIYHFNEMLELLDEPELLTAKYLDNLLGVKSPIGFSYDDQQFTGHVKGLDEIGRIHLTANGSEHGPFSLKEVSFII